MITLKDCIGKRVLVYDVKSYLNSSYSEMDILEFSPSGNYVKVKMHKEFWVSVSDFDVSFGRYWLKEILGDIKE